ncbi:hypothetical protein PLICRDRAFT_30426 [Plicaturopsis crispa FD-325 SS-3]|nr:hypothetical protein PLICRDRAFT_30426 [Plicaturopsis crispa FD-325 SS-3]
MPSTQDLPRFTSCENNELHIALGRMFDEGATKVWPTHRYARVPRMDDTIRRPQDSLAASTSIRIINAHDQSTCSHPRQVDLATVSAVQIPPLHSVPCSKAVQAFLEARSDGLGGTRRYKQTCPSACLYMPYPSAAYVLTSPERLLIPPAKQPGARIRRRWASTHDRHDLHEPGHVQGVGLLFKCGACLVPGIPVLIKFLSALDEYKYAAKGLVATSFAAGTWIHNSLQFVRGAGSASSVYALLCCYYPRPRTGGALCVA